MISTRRRPHLYNRASADVRHWGRDRQMEKVLPAYEYQENWVTPWQEKKKALDRAQFAPVMDEYYRCLGWMYAPVGPHRND